MTEHEINSFHAHCNIKNAKNQFCKPVLENILLKTAYKISNLLFYLLLEVRLGVFHPKSKLLALFNILSFSLTNIIRVHCSTIQIHLKCKIRSSLRCSLSILHLSLSCAAAKPDATTKQQHCRLRRYPGSANKQRHHYRTCNPKADPPAGRLPNRPACCTKT